MLLTLNIQVAIRHRMDLIFSQCVFTQCNQKQCDRHPCVWYRPVTPGSQATAAPGTVGDKIRNHACFDSMTPAVPPYRLAPLSELLPRRLQAGCTPTAPALGRFRANDRRKRTRFRRSARRGQTVQDRLIAAVQVFIGAVSARSTVASVALGELSKLPYHTALSHYYPEFLPPGSRGPSSTVTPAFYSRQFGGCSRQQSRHTFTYGRNSRNRRDASGTQQLHLPSTIIWSTTAHARPAGQASSAGLQLPETHRPQPFCQCRLRR